MVAIKDDFGPFIVPCTIGIFKFAKTLCDLGASINLISFTINKCLGLGEPLPIMMHLPMDDYIIKYPLGVLYYMLVRVEKFILLPNFIILVCEVDMDMLIILARPFLYIGRAFVDAKSGDLIFRINEEEVIFSQFQSLMLFIKPWRVHMSK